MSGPTTVSVVMPVFNAGPYIGEALASIAAQTYAPAEVILVDDGSTDESIRIAQEAASSLGLAIAIRHTDREGAGGARNEGIRAATGEWIALLDADDVWLPGHLARAVMLLRQAEDAAGEPSEVVAYQGHIETMSADGSVVEPVPCPIDAPCIAIDHRAAFEVHAAGMFNNQTNVYRRDRLIEIGMHDVTMSRRQDFDLWLRLIAGCRCVLDPTVGARYRLGLADSLSQAKPAASFYRVQALTNSRADYDSPTYRRVLGQAAYDATILALARGTRDDRRRAIPLCLPEVAGRARRLLLRLASWMPWAVRLLWRWRHGG